MLNGGSDCRIQGNWLPGVTAVNKTRLQLTFATLVALVYRPSRYHSAATHSQVGPYLLPASLLTDLGSIIST